MIESDPDLSADEIRQRFVRWWSEIGEVQLEEYGYRLMDTTGEPGPTEGLPDDLARVLRDQSIIVPQDAAVFELIAKWRNAPSNTASAD